jgi:hypothetical protein
MCTPSDGAGPSNALGGFVNALLGGAGKTQEQLREASRSITLSHTAADLWLARLSALTYTTWQGPTTAVAQLGTAADVPAPKLLLTPPPTQDM